MSSFVLKYRDTLRVEMPTEAAIWSSVVSVNPWLTKSAVARSVICR
jgi:hypothetical protein